MNYITGKYHRQTIFSTDFNEVTIQACFRQYSTSKSGILRYHWSNQDPDIRANGYIAQVTFPVNQVFQLVPCTSHVDAEEARFEYFKQYILTPLIRSNQPHTLIVCPSYLHYVRIRNELLKREVRVCLLVV